jgi:heterodisulfide reductase subunit A-like polyferredoxin
MGFFKDIHKVTQQAKEIDKTFNAKDQMATALDKMKNANQMFQNQTAAMNAASAATAGAGADGIEATAQVVSVGFATGAVNMDVMLPVQFLIMQEGLPPRPMDATILVPPTQMQHMTPGTVLPVKLSASNPNALAVDWLKQI